MSANLENSAVATGLEKVSFHSNPTIRVFQMSQLCASGGQNIGVSASTSVLPMNIQHWFPLG